MSGPTLDSLRAEIDRLDDQLIALLLRRAEIAAEVAPLKARIGAPMLRPGREAAVLRRLVAQAGKGFDPLALVRIWREIMSSALRVQGSFSVAVSAPDGGLSCWGLARTQYGINTTMTGVAGPAQAIAQVASGKADVAIVPFPAVEDRDPWWARLMADGAPRVVARLPVAEGLSPRGGAAEGLAIAVMAPESSGEDRSLIAMETVESLSRAALSRAFETAKLTVRFSAGRGGGGTTHLAEVDGFIAADDPALGRLRAALGDSVRDVVVIGAYAVPLRLAGAS